MKHETIEPDVRGMFSAACMKDAGYNPNYRRTKTSLWEAVAGDEADSIGVSKLNFGEAIRFEGGYVAKHWLPDDLDGRKPRILHKSDFREAMKKSSSYNIQPDPISKDAIWFLRHSGQGGISAGCDDRGIFKMYDLILHLRKRHYFRTQNLKNDEIIMIILFHVFHDNKGRYQVIGVDVEDAEMGPAGSGEVRSGGSATAANRSERNQVSISRFDPNAPVPLAIRATSGWSIPFVRADLVGIKLSPQHS